MCGIAGIFNRQGEISGIDPMLSAMKLRGPDDQGQWVNRNRNLVMGQTRLSIIDLSNNGHQPMHSISERFTIVFNGEIYNFKELKLELIELGCIFKSSSDTEVILNAWERWGEDTPKRLRGMFAFAIWDSLFSTLTLVRDRFGIKPLLWFKSPDGILFASSLSALLCSNKVPRQLNKKSFFDFLSLGSVFQPATMIEGVSSLMPGMMVVIDEHCELTFKAYWKLKSDPSMIVELSKLSYGEQIIETRKLLEEACRYHMIADVPVGSFLSGGVDSTIITALMARQSRHPVYTFSIGFENVNGIENELADAKKAAEFIGCKHTELLVTGKDISNCFDDFICALDQPSNDGINSFLVSRLATQKVKVALSGLGADELFAGYPHFGWPEKYTNRSPHVKDYLFNYLYEFVPWASFAAESKLKTSSPKERLSYLRRVHSDEEIRKIISSGIANSFRDSHILKYINSLDIKDGNDVDQIIQYECKGYLVNTLLRDVDALSMGHSLEVRPVFLDHKLAEFALSLPISSKWRNANAKAILKDTGKDLLPQDYFNRPKKGFTLPTLHWLNSDLSDRFQSTLNEASASQFFNKTFLSNLIVERENPRKNKAAWMIFIFLEWIRANNIVTDTNIGDKSMYLQRSYNLQN